MTQFGPKVPLCVLNDLYFKTTCNIRPHFLGPMGGLKIEGLLYKYLPSHASAMHAWPGCRPVLSTTMSHVGQEDLHVLEEEMVIRSPSIM